jgi:CBS domain-containing protein
MENIRVSDIMTRDPITINPNANLLECARKMIKKRVGNLLLVDNKKLVGIISEKDILWALIKKSKKDLKTIRASDISPRKLYTIKPSYTVKEAISRMKKGRFERLPVVHDNELTGIITIKDILNFHPEIYPEMEEFAKIREETSKLKRIKMAGEAKEGRCEECGEKDILCNINGIMLCESCRKDA